MVSRGSNHSIPPYDIPCADKFYLRTVRQMEEVDVMLLAIVYMLKLLLMEFVVAVCCYLFGWDFQWGYAITAWLLICVIGGAHIER